MKKILLCVMMSALCVSAAFGGPAQDLLAEIVSISKTYKSEKEIISQAKKLITPDRIKAIVSSGDDVNVKGEQGITLLIAATLLANDPEIVDILLKSGADVNAREKGGRNALFFALYHDPANAEVVRLLAEAGADPKVKWNGRTARDLALKNKNPEVQKMAHTLLTNTNGSGPVQTLLGEVMYVMMTPRVSWKQRGTQIRKIITLDRVKAIIASGADVNAKGEQGITLLMVAAAFSDNPEIVSALLNAGADVNTRVYGGSTILMQAVIHSENPEIIRTLLDAGADVNAKDQEGFTAKHLAAGNKNPKIRSMF